MCFWWLVMMVVMVVKVVKVMGLVKVVLSNTWAEVSSSSGCCSSRAAQGSEQTTT